ncbi:MAG: glycosyltransferase family 1 protein [Acidobacteriota bacterium]
MGIDCRALHSGPAGIATYVRNLLREIPELECLDASWPRNNLLWNHLRAPWAQLGHRWKVYHAPSYTAPLLNFCKLVLMVADVSYLVREDWYPYTIDPLRRRYYQASLFRADRIIVPSDFTRSELVRLYPALDGRLRRVYLGVSDRFRKDEALASQARQEFGLPERFILHVGDIHPRRNLDQLQIAAQQIGMPLVLVGKILRGGEGFAHHPHHLSGLTLDQLIGVYSAATLLGYPSSYEGFGFPLVEAMACQLPVVASNRSCIPEICADAAVLVEPQADALKKGIEEALLNASALVEKGRQRASQLTWQKTARETLEVYRELI